MAAIAAFAKSDQGQEYAAVCRYWGVDPAAGFTDDVVAMNLRAALFASSFAVPAEEPDDWAAAGEANRREWLAGV